MASLIDYPPLTDEEMAQLRDLLLRYIAHQGSKVANLAIGALAAKLQGNKVIDVTPAPPTD